MKKALHALSLLLTCAAINFITGAALLFATHTAFGAGTVGNFVIPPDVPAKYPTNIRPAPTYTDARVLAANVAEVWTAPANARIVLFSSNCDFYANANAAAAVPAADVSDGTASELNPTAWYFSTPVTTIGLIAPTACVVTMAVYLGR